MAIRYGGLSRNVSDSGLAAELERQRTGGTPGRWTAPTVPKAKVTGQLPMPTTPDFAKAVRDTYWSPDDKPPTIGGLGGLMSSLDYGRINRDGDPFGIAWHDAFDKTLEKLRLQRGVGVPQPMTFGGGSGGGGGGGSAAEDAVDYSAAIQSLRDKIAGVSAQYDPYREQLASAAAASRGQISDATAQALARLAQIDPEAAFQWSVQQTQTPAAAGMNYLQAIDASAADVEAVRALNEALLAQQLGSSQQAAAGYQAALANEREARRVASELMRQEALQNLAAQEAAYRAQIQDAERKARDALQAQLIEYELAQAGG